jgi:acyl-CoA hydrolase
MTTTEFVHIPRLRKWLWSAALAAALVVLASTAHGDSISKIVSRLAPGDVVTTLKNTVDKVVTEWGVAELFGRSLRERAEALIEIAHPDFRADLRRAASRINLV